jgi:hypothetical protein
METLEAIWASRVEIMAWAGSAIIALSGLVKVLQGAEGSLKWLAAKTETDADDKAVKWYSAALTSLAGWLGFAGKVVRPLSLRGKGKP